MPEACIATLFFDEVDALLGMRSEVDNARDCYTNTEVNYLFQRLEEFAGIVVMATNLLSNMDETFAHHMRYFVVFPSEDAQCCESIWF